MTTDVAIRSQQTPVSTMDGSAVHYVDESALAACIPYGHMHAAHVRKSANLVELSKGVTVLL